MSKWELMYLFEKFLEYPMPYNMSHHSDGSATLVKEFVDGNYG